MNNKKPHEKEIFSMMDELSEYLDEEYIDVLDADEDINEEEILDEIQFQNIKKKVYKNLSLNQSKDKDIKNINKRKSSRKKSQFLKIAAAIVIIFGLIFVAYPNEVIAVLKKPLNYIPGINTVMDSEEASERYVLEKPVTINHDGMKIELMSVIIQNDNNYILVNARGSSKEIFKEGNDINYENVWIKFSNGDMHNLNGYGVSGGSQNWDGSFGNWLDVSKGNVNNRFIYEEGDTIEVILGTENEMTVPVTLIKAPGFENYAELGPTTMVNDISITAISSFEDNGLKINLISPKIQGRFIDEYALSPSFSFNEERFKYKGILNERIALYDDEGNLVHGEGLGSYSPPLSEFHFDMTDSDSDNFRLVIPYIKMKYPVEETFKIKLPEIGESLEYDDYIIELNEYKLKINKIERITSIPGESVKIYFDTGYNENLDESMYEIILRSDQTIFTEPIYQSWSGSYAEEDDQYTLGSLKFVDINLNKRGLKEFDLYIDSIVTVKKGPWEFEIQR